MSEQSKICKRCGGVNGHKQVEDPMAGDSHMLTTMPCPFDNYIHPNRKLSEPIKEEPVGEIKYGIAQDNSVWFDLWHGPNPSLEEILKVDGRNENSCIWRFNADGTNKLLCRWSSFADGWMIEL